jgi:serine/threonine protein kinase/ABC-type branched-subunit amino acid transport system substrate-binding protein
MSYCINPQCSDRPNPDTATSCQACNTQLSLYGGRFQVLAKISKPNHNPASEVFRVADAKDNRRPKVLKTLTNTTAEFVTRFDREIEILKKSKNSGIPAYIIDFDLPASATRPELHCLVMEWIEGEDLEAWLATNGKLAYEQIALTWLNKIAIVLAYLHSKKHFHRDIKPSNIMLRDNGELALIDFGIVREITQTVDLYGASTHAYTPVYAAPEQLSGNAVPQSDFYALGKTFVQLLTGQRPIPNELDLSRWEYETAFPTSGIIPLINWLLQEDLEQRPQTPAKILETINYISTRKADGDFPNSEETSDFIDRSQQTILKSRQHNLPAKITLFVSTVSLILGSLYYYFSLSPTTVKQVAVRPPADLISFGERPIKDSYGSDKSGKQKSIQQKLAGIQLFKEGRYKEAYQKFDESHAGAKQDPDILIYMNNAKVRYWHQRKPTQPIYTIAAVVPAAIEQGQHILFGVAHLQDRVVDRTESIDVEPEVYLEIGIADDLHQPEQAVAIAKKLVEPSLNGGDNQTRSILAVIGHDSSEFTCEALPIYSQAGLSVISATSSMNEMRKRCGDRDRVFFRTVSSTQFESRSSIELLKIKNIQNLKITSFYKKEKIGFSRDLFEIFKQDFKKEFSRELEAGFDLSDAIDVAKGIERAKSSNVIVLFSDEKADAFNVFNNAIKVLEAADPSKIDLIIGSNPLLSAEIGATLLQKWHDKLVISVDWSADPQCSDREFVKIANKLWDGDINHTTAASYEAAQVLSQLFKNGTNTNRARVKDALKNISNVRSQVFNNKYISFDDDGNRTDIQQKILLTPTVNNKKSTFKPIDKNQCSL